MKRLAHSGTDTGSALENNIPLSAKTQIARSAVSAPVRELLARYPAVIRGRTVFHSGEGKAFEDTAALRRVAKIVYPYDPNSPNPAHRVLPPVGTRWDVAVGIYVLNTLTRTNRHRCLQECFTFAASGVFAVRADKIAGVPADDGVITSRGTFQKSYTHAEVAQEFAKWGPSVLLPTPGYILFRLHP